MALAAADADDDDDKNDEDTDVMDPAWATDDAMETRMAASSDCWEADVTSTASGLVLMSWECEAFLPQRTGDCRSLVMFLAVHLEAFGSMLVGVGVCRNATSWGPGDLSESDDGGRKTGDFIGVGVLLNERGRGDFVGVADGPLLVLRMCSCSISVRCCCSFFFCSFSNSRS